VNSRHKPRRHLTSAAPSRHLAFRRTGF